MRLNNLELRKVDDGNKYFEIVKWFPNIHYKKESEYTKNGDSYTKNNNHFIHESCFENPEYCFSLTFIKNGIPDFISNRPLELETLQEMKDYLCLLRKGVRKSL